MEYPISIDFDELEIIPISCHPISRNSVKNAWWAHSSNTIFSTIFIFGFNEYSRAESYFYMTIKILLVVLNRSTNNDKQTIDDANNIVLVHRIIVVEQIGILTKCSSQDSPLPISHRCAGKVHHGNIWFHWYFKTNYIVNGVLHGTATVSMWYAEHKSIGQCPHAPKHKNTTIIKCATEVTNNDKQKCTGKIDTIWKPSLGLMHRLAPSLSRSLSLP